MFAPHKFALTQFAEVRAISADSPTSDPPTPTAPTPPTDDLPEWEPLTPELVEDEAVRGDFMLRWAVVLLALLLGCAEVSSTTTLVHLKTGQYISSHGWRPPATDVFSSTAADRPWINVGWLFDLSLSGTYTAAGFGGFSLLTALLAAVTFGFLVHTSRPEVSTWWGSVCAALAILVCYRQFTPQPEIVALLGVAVTLWFVQQWKVHERAVSLWWLVPIFVLWSNLDNRMFLGLAALLLYAAGETLGSFFGRPGIADRGKRRQLWQVIAACLVAAMFNPFGWHALLAPFSLYGVEYPALRQHYALSPSVTELEFFPLVGPGAAIYWSLPSQHTAAALLLLTAAAVAMGLNQQKVDGGHVLLALGFLGFGLAASHELAAACLVASVVATLNAQQWYQENFRQTYSTETRELLFSRGGRALTVLALFVFAYLGISGRLAGPQQHRMGIGLDANVQTAIDGFREQLADSFDDRPFNFVFSQGDLLIWIGKKPFIDHRTAVYGGKVDESLLALHNEIRHALRKKRMNDDISGRPDIWKAALDRFGVTHVLPRMSGNSPDYLSYFDLVRSPENWQLTSLGGATAVFYRNDLAQPDLQDYLATHKFDVLKEAFAGIDDEPAIRIDWARPRSFYQKYLSLPKIRIPNSIQAARHCLNHLEALQQSGAVELDQALAYAYLTIRKANQGLVEDPQSVDGYYILGTAYKTLLQIENGVGLASGVRYSNELRPLLTICALNQAIAINPDIALLHHELYEVYFSMRKFDLALRSLQEYNRLTGDRDDLSGGELMQKQLDTPRLQQMQNLVQQTNQQVQQMLQPGNRLQLAEELYNGGLALKALELLEDDPILLLEQPDANQLLGILLMEAGRVEEASRVFEQFEKAAGRSGMTAWRSPAAVAQMANGNYLQATRFWSAEVYSQKDTRMDAVLQTFPMTSSPLLFVGQWRDMWPRQQTLTATDVLYALPDSLSGFLWNIAICQLETGDAAAAAESIRAILAENPDTLLRPILRVYLRLIGGDDIDVVAPSDRIPVTADMFEPEPADTKE